jgi:hypothetical protein
MPQRTTRRTAYLAGDPEDAQAHKDLARLCRAVAELQEAARHAGSWLPDPGDPEHEQERWAAIAEVCDGLRWVLNHAAAELDSFLPRGMEGFARAVADEELLEAATPDAVTGGILR